MPSSVVMVTPLVARSHSVVHYFLCYVTLSRNRNDYQPHNHTQVGTAIHTTAVDSSSSNVLH